jgi:hypothetical protein
MISAASLKHSIEQTINGSSGASTGCVTVSNYCFAGSCDCSPCPHDPFHCCLLTLGNCTSTASVPYGLCAPACKCDGY